ncbi:MAG: hypothetical protein QM528_03320 [Phycisphaerales bacterium]|nr:hypothetical protein [Phycisphaerales bacterium]
MKQKFENLGNSFKRAQLKVLKGGKLKNVDSNSCDPTVVDSCKAACTPYGVKQQCGTTLKSCYACDKVGYICDYFDAYGDMFWCN